MIPGLPPLFLHTASDQKLDGGKAWNEATVSHLMDDRVYLPTLGQKFCVDTPRSDISLRRITDNLLKFTREYGDILECQYPLGQTLKNHP